MVCLPAARSRWSRAALALWPVALAVRAGETAPAVAPLTGLAAPQGHVLGSGHAARSARAGAFLLCTASERRACQQPLTHRVMVRPYQRPGNATERGHAN